MQLVLTAALKSLVHVPLTCNVAVTNQILHPWCQLPITWPSLDLVVARHLPRKTLACCLLCRLFCTVTGLLSPRCLTTLSFLLLSAWTPATAGCGVKKACQPLTGPSLGLSPGYLCCQPTTRQCHGPPSHTLHHRRTFSLKPISRRRKCPTCALPTWITKAICLVTAVGLPWIPLEMELSPQLE